MTCLLDICLCSHNPEPGRLKRVLSSLANQKPSNEQWRLIVVDNNSQPPIEDHQLDIVRQSGRDVCLIREPLEGVINARKKAIMSSSAKWLLFVDDDNILSPDYISNGIDYAKNNYVGCFGGNIYLDENVKVDKWIVPLLPLLAIRDYGSNEIVSMLDRWGPWMPPSAGLFIRREIAIQFINLTSKNAAYESLGRRGKQLKSGLDYMMVREGPRMGYPCAYVPKLKLCHDLDPGRLAIGYMLRINWSYGRSHVIIRNIDRNTPGRKSSPGALRRRMLVYMPIRMLKELFVSPRYFICRQAYRLGYFWQRSVSFVAFRLGI